LASSKADLKAIGQSKSVPVLMSSAVSDGMGIRGHALTQAEELEEGPATSKTVKDKSALLALELFPPAWLLGLDRFYLGSFRTGIAKVLVSLLTLSLGGFAWGLVDFSAVVLNALRKEESIHVLGMHVDFTPNTLQAAFVLAVVDLVMLPLWVVAAKYAWKVRKGHRMERLKANAMKSPHFKTAAAADNPVKGT